MENFGNLKIELHETEERLLTELRTLRRGLRGIQDGSQTGDTPLTMGQRIADAVAATMGSWTFIIAQSVALMFGSLLTSQPMCSSGTPIHSSCSISRSRSKQPMQRPSS